jgi:formylmethanofuran dehydrogenase subunit E-like metal-binding protein
MLFRRKKDVDLRDLQKKGLIRIPREEVNLKTDRNGFIEFDRPNNNLKKDEITSPVSETNFFNILDDNSNLNNSLSKNNSQANNNLNQNELRELTRKFEEIDNKLYRLEQRIEVLERKSNLGDSSNYSWQN